MDLSIVTTIYCSASYLEEFYTRASGAARRIFDISEQMIAKAKELHERIDYCEFFTDESRLSKEDYTIASGIFNVKPNASDEEWKTYMIHTLGKMAELSAKGFAFNVLTKYSDRELMRSDLYYADPCNLFKIVANPWAVGATEGKGELTISARSGWSTMAHEPPGGFSFLPKAGKPMVRVATLDTYCREQGLSPTVIKIDVEGLETEVLAGARTILEQSRPCLLIEINPLRLAAAGTSGEDLILQLSRLRYRLFHIDPRCAKSILHAKRDEWRGFPEVKQNDIVMGQDFDAIALPGELVAGSL